MDRKKVVPVTHLSFMNKIRSLANSPLARLDKHENSNSANVKKNLKIPVKRVRKEKQVNSSSRTRTQPILETRNIVPVIKTSISNESNITDQKTNVTLW